MKTIRERVKCQSRIWGVSGTFMSDEGIVRMEGLPTPRSTQETVSYNVDSTVCRGDSGL